MRNRDTKAITWFLVLTTLWFESACTFFPARNTDVEDTCNEMSGRWAEHFATCVQYLFAIPPGMAQDQATLCRSMADLAGAGTVHLDEASASACFSDIRSLPCDVTLAGLLALSPLALFRLSQNCASVFAGTVPLGGPCSMDVACVPGEWCDRSKACPGTCETSMPPGYPCKSSRDCASGLCGAAKTCIASLSGGSPCSATADCDPGLACLPATHTCELPVAHGPCSSNADCIAGEHCVVSGGSGSCTDPSIACTPGLAQCSFGLYCYNGGCSPWPFSPGEPCGLLGGEQAPCIGTWCSADYSSGAYMTAGTCQDLLPEGSTCTPQPVVSQMCMIGSLCVGGVCMGATCF